VIDQMRRSFGHAPGITQGAHAAMFAGVGDQEILLALVTVRSGKTMRENRPGDSMGEKKKGV